MVSSTLKSCVITVSMSFSAAVFAAPVTCQAERWMDGDTADMRIGGDLVRVRLAGYDAPERGQPFWRSARDQAAQAVAGGASCDCYKADKYGRSVCTVRVSGVNVATTMALAGLACIDPRFEGEASEADREAARAAVALAQAERAGMWQDPGAVCGWEYRRAKNAKRSGN